MAMLLNINSQPHNDMNWMPKCGISFFSFKKFLIGHYFLLLDKNMSI